MAPKTPLQAVQVYGRKVISSYILLSFFGRVFASFTKFLIAAIIGNSIHLNIEAQ